ncbi:hypothetical protein QOT17_024341 [Balamuthia mandrillaris]
MTVGYALTSAKDVIVASLYHIHMEETGGEQVPQKIQDTVNLAAKKCKQRAPSCTRSGRMRDACLRDDVIQIITMIPDGKRKKARDASCWLHSVSTGARAITASNILLGHFQNFIIQDPSDPHITKGKPGDWNHMITLGFKPTSSSLASIHSDLNAAYLVLKTFFILEEFYAECLLAN